MSAFLEAYKGLNTEQKKAVDTIDGPVMVIAGPGTGKTQVLALRIANILTKTDTPPDGVLCLTFTNAGVKAMRERLIKYIGPTATRVRIATFHSFGMQLLEKFYAHLGLPSVPQLLDDATSVVLLDELFFAKEWQHLRPRHNPALYFRDLKSLISLLKRDRVTSEMFSAMVSADIERLTNDSESISSRGETKGQLKKDVQKKIEGLKRSLEVAEFYALYEHTKEARNIIDYNDVLELMVRLVEESDEARDYLREQFLYVLVDEHQDSSGIQNDFLQGVWQEIERPNIFVVGDDRQLIYGFGGASLAYFEGFKNTFGKAELLTLTTNYRSTQTILDSAEALLQSTLAEGKLAGNTKESHPIKLIEADYPRDEIIAAALSIKEKIATGVLLDDCALLVPKNYQVKAAVRVLRDMDIPVAALGTLKLFELPETEFLLQVLICINDPYDQVAVSRTILDPLSGISLLDAHRFLHENNPRKLSTELLLASEQSAVQAWGARLRQWMEELASTDTYGLIQIIGNEVLLQSARDDEEVRARVEVVRTMLHLVLAHIERAEDTTLAGFLTFIERLKQYDEDVPLAIFAANKGVKVLTLHGSKGLEFDFVWIAHMDERSLMSSKKQAFVLPRELEEQAEAQDEEEAKRKLYVAITRAKRFCSISHARYSYTGGEQQVASIIAALPEGLFEKQSVDATEDVIMASDPEHYVARGVHERGVQDLASLVSEQYQERSVSVTLLNNFFECPWKWYFRNLLQLPEPENDSLHIGNVVHKSFEYVLKQSTVPSVAELTTHISQCALIEARHNESAAKRFAETATRIAVRWMNDYVSTLQQPYEVERSIPYHDVNMPELSFYGKIDVVETLSEGNVRVTDWKTGSVKSKADIDRVDEEGRMSSYLRQLTMYSYLLEGHTHHAVSVQESRLVFVEAVEGDKNAVVTRVITKEDLARLEKDIQDYRQLLQSGDWISRPCQAKSYGADSVCEYCTMANKYGIFSPITKAK